MIIDSDSMIQIEYLKKWRSKYVKKREMTDCVNQLENINRKTIIWTNI